MEFSLPITIKLLSQTPPTLTSMLIDLPDEWLSANEGGESWSPVNVLNHLIHGEQTDWIVRLKIILSEKSDKSFEPFNRVASIQSVEKMPVKQLLKMFSHIRAQNLDYLKSLQLTDSDLLKTGIHPDFGEVTLKQLLATWAVHDLGHITQISRVIAKQYKDEVGPWIKYLSILK